MSYKTKRRVDRIVAAVLALLLTVQLMPMNTFAELTENENQQLETTEETATITGTVTMVSNTEGSIGEQESSSEDESETSSENESETSSENESETSSENESETSSENESETSAEGESETSSEDESEMSTEGESEKPTEDESETSSEEQAAKLSTRSTGDMVGTAVAGATITVTDASGVEVTTATTADDGTYIISGLTKGEVYRISVECTGYHTVENILVSFDNTDESGNYVNDIVMQDASVADMYFAFNERVICYTENPDGRLAFVVIDPTGQRVIEYSSSDENIATVNDIGLITPVGIGTVTITAADINSGATSSYELTVKKAVQAELIWDNSVPDNLTWKDSFVNTVTGGTGDGAVTYEITEEKALSGTEDNIADIDADKGILTLYKAGIITVKATKAGTNSSGAEVYEPATAEYTLKINRVIVDDFVFSEENPSTITFEKNDFANVASSTTIINDGKADATGAVTYEIIKEMTLDNTETTGVATVAPDTGVVTPIRSGIVEVKATKTADDYYEAAEGTYILSINKSAQNAFAFKLGEECNMTLGEEFTNEALNAKNLPVVYTIIEELKLDGEEAAGVAAVDPDTGEVTAFKAGIVRIAATSPSDDRYSERTIEYTLTINRADQTVVFENGHENIPAIDYGTQTEYINKATANTVITYTSSDDTVATVDSITGVVTILKPGTVTITATACEDECYNVATNSYKLTINKANQTITFTNGAAHTVRFNDNNNMYINTAANVDGAKADRYEIVSGLEFIAEASFDETSGQFTIGGAGTIQIKAIYDENDYYRAADSTYTLTVEKANQTIAFPQTTYEVIVGDDFRGVSAQLTGANSGEAIEYTLKTGSDVNGVVESVGFNDGVIKFTEPYIEGSATIIAKIPSNENYNEATAEYTIKVKMWTPTGDEVTVKDTDNNESNWYTDKVYIYAKDGYLISHSAGDDNWETQLTDVVTADSADTAGTEVTVYVKNVAEGYIGPLTIKVQKDSAAPTASIAIEGDSAWDKLLTILTFGLWDKASVDMTITSNDTLSGVASVQYVVVEGSTELKTEAELNAIEAENWISYTGTASIDKNALYVVYAKVTDNAGNYVYATTNGIVSDKSSPAVDMEILTESQGGFYTENVKIKVTASDWAPYSGIAKIEYKVECDGSVTQTGTLYDFADEKLTDPSYSQLVSSWNSDDYGEYIEVNADTNNEDDVAITVTVTDNAGHVSTDTEVIDIYVAHKTSEIIDVTFTDETDKVGTLEGTDVYASNRTAEITITGRRSSFTTPKVVITAIGADGKAVDNAYTITDWDISGSNRGSEAAMKATVTFDASARYELDIKYTDKTEQVTDHYRSGFIIDNDNPTATVTIDGNTWEELLEVLTFGIYKNTSMTVTASAADSTSDVAKLEYYVSDSTSIMTVEQLDAITTWTEYSPFTVNVNKVFTVYVKATDYAGNHSYISSAGHIVDMENSTILIDPVDANVNGFYNKDVAVDITVQEPTHLSGISSIVYWVTTDGVITQEEAEIFNFASTMNDKVPTYNDLEFTLSETVVVNSTDCNGDNVVVHVKATDNAGNVYEAASEVLKINSTIPTIKVSYENNAGNMVGGLGYFKEDRVAEIAIKDRDSTFDADNVVITVSGIKSDGTAIALDLDDMKSEWESADGTHTLRLTFSEEGKYTYSVSYTNKADMSASQPATGDSVSPFNFVIDKEAPEASMTEGANKWATLLETLTFGLYSNGKITLLASSEDNFSDECTVHYYIDDSAAQLTIEQLEANADWTLYKGEISVDKDMKFSVYLKVTDYAGNVRYINSDGYILDKQAPVVQFNVDKADKTHNGVGVYKEDVEVTIDVTDKEPYSGIDTIEYWVTADGVETQREVLFDYTGTSANQADRQHEYTANVTIDSEANNACDVRVYVRVTDMLNNVYTTTADEALRLDIDAAEPKVVITYNDDEPYQTLSGVGYYKASRTAKVVVTERTAHFDFDDIKNTFVITGKKANGENAIGDYKTMFTAPTTVEGATVNDAEHTFDIVFSKNANYTLSVNYKDMAGNSGIVTASTEETPYSFTVDRDMPMGSITVGKLGTWDKLLSTLTFGLWTNATLDVTATATDATSEVSVYYIKTDSSKTMTADELRKLTAWQPYNRLTVSSDEQFVIYLKLVDRAGNTTYISTNGVVVDKTKPAVETVQPAITVTPQQPVNGIYNDNVTVAVKVTDTIKNGTYSGLKEIRYEVINLGEVTQKGILFSGGTDRTQTWSKANAIVVDKALNNSNDVVVKVYAVDNVGNEASSSAAIRIDTTAPSIDVRYDNNTGETEFADAVYFNANRVATITITERNFDPDNVALTITNTDGAQPVLSGWTEHKSNAGNGDTTAYTATLTYSADGDYTFDISYTDMAGNKSTAADYGASLAPTEFTIDKTAPVIQVAYDNNEAQNGNYFAADRVATITVTEHNFEQSGIVLTLTATQDGTDSALPAVGEWRSDGDVHTLNITYANDSLYTFDIDYIDKAGNALADMAQHSFYVDKTMPSLSITEITDKSANNSDGDIGLVITATDVNFDVFKPVITAFVKNENGEIEPVTYEMSAVGAESDVDNGKRYTVTNLEEDGIYRITCTLVDKAGNEYTEVLLEKEDGSTYTEQRAGEDTLLSFSVNRYGSTYALDEATSALVQNYYVQNVDDDITITEVNADQLNEYRITLNGEELVEATDYTVTKEHEEGKWYSYTYLINKSFFETDGEYTIVVSSKDKATNDSFSDVKGTSVTFVIDRTAPVVTVTGLAKDTNYQTESQRATLVPTDDGGALKSIVVSLVDDDGGELKKLLNLADEELDKALEAGDGKLTFEVGEGLNQNVKIVCADCAVDANGNTNVYTETITGISVSTSQMMIWWSNKPLRYGIFGGVAVVGIGAAALVLRKRAKRR